MLVFESVIARHIHAKEEHRVSDLENFVANLLPQQTAWVITTTDSEGKLLTKITTDVDDIDTSIINALKEDRPVTVVRFKYAGFGGYELLITHELA